MSSSNRMSLARPWVLCTATASRTRRSRRSTSRRRRLLVAPGQLGQVADQVGQLLELHEDVVDQHGAVLDAQLVDPADHLEVGAQAGQRGAQLVGRVEDELALGPPRRLERLEQAVERAAQAAQLVGAAGGQPARDVGRLGQVLDRVGEGVQRDEGGARHEPAEDDGEQDADERDDAEQQRQRPQLRAGVEERGDLQRAPVDEEPRLHRRAGGQVLDELAHLVPAHGDRREERRRQADGDQPHLAGDREAAPGDDRAAGVDHLAERGGGRADLLAGHDPLRGGRERVVGRLEQRVAGDQERGEGGRQHGDHHGHRGRQDEPGAEGHASRST